MATDQKKLRAVRCVVRGERRMEGAGQGVHRAFPTNRLDEVDPFLLLDRVGPHDWGPGEAKGTPDHPHAGFEVVMYMLDGRLEHRDSEGNAGVLEPGDVQWMRAGRGIVHSEIPEEEFSRAGGRFQALQLWINLPRERKREPPAYRDIPAEEIPVAESPDGGATVRVIAGKALGVHANVPTHAPILHQHWTVQPGGRVVQPLPEAYNALAYVMEGSGRFGEEETPAGRGEVVVFGRDGAATRFGAPGNADRTLSVVLIGGEPLDERIVRYGPFVANTWADAFRSMHDYRKGRMGEVGRG